MSHGAWLSAVKPGDGRIQGQAQGEHARFGSHAPPALCDSNVDGRAHPVTGYARTNALRRHRSLLLVLTPLVSIGTLMLGVYVGASAPVRAASVFTAPPGMPPRQGAPAPFAWQIFTYLEDRGVRETIPIRGLTVIARRGDEESRWAGDSNADGVAEATLALTAPSPGDVIEVEVLVQDEPFPLARGSVVLEDEPRWARTSEEVHETAAARPSKREGPIALDVWVEGARLVVGFETPVWVRVRTPSEVTAADVSVRASPEAGLRVTREELTVGCDGWAELRAVAEGHVAGVTLDARSPPTATGVWFGALPVAPGAFFVDAPRFIPEGEPTTALVVAPNPRRVVYAEIDDERGRVFAAALEVGVSSDDPVPRAKFTFPELAPGLHWLVVSGEPRGAERLAGAAIAKPFLVGKASNVIPDTPCSIGPWLAQRPAEGFPRKLGIDGMATRGASNRANHRLGLFVGLLALAAGAAIEILLLVDVARESRAKLRAADHVEGNERASAPIGGNLLLAILVAILGFALLASLLIAKG